MNILSCVNQIIELLQALICINYLCRSKYFFKIYDCVFAVAEVILLEIVNIYHISLAYTLIGYLGVYVYAYIKFKDGFKKTSVNVVLYLIINSFVQLVFSGTLFFLSYFVPVVGGISGILIINSMSLLFLFVVRRQLHRISRYVLNSNVLTYIAMLGTLFIIVYLLVVYKVGKYFRVTDYVVFGLVTALVCVLSLSWQKEKYEKTAKEKEIALREQYDEMFHDLVTSVRRKQHDIDDHITAIYCQHKMAKSLEELISVQEQYCDWIKEDNAFSHLLRADNPVLGGFLYSKFCQAKEIGCSIDYEVKIQGLQCRIPVYQIIEILTVLLNNALEALKSREKKTLQIKIIEDNEKLIISVQNSFDYVPREELVRFIQPGYSTKGKNRGQGLAKVMDILHCYNGELLIESEKGDFDSWVAINVSIKKEGEIPPA